MGPKSYMIILLSIMEMLKDFIRNTPITMKILEFKCKESSFCRLYLAIDQFHSLRKRVMESFISNLNHHVSLIFSHHLLMKIWES